LLGTAWGATAFEERIVASEREMPVLPLVVCASMFIGIHAVVLAAILVLL